MAFSWASDKPVDDMLMRAVFVAEGVVLLGDMVVHSLGDGTQVRISPAPDDEMVSGQERFVHTRELFSRSGRGSYARYHRSVLGGDSQ